MNNKISIIIPTYNNPDKLLKAAASIYLNDHNKDIEIVIVDDCSTCDYKSVINYLKIRGQKIKYIKNNKNVGAGVSRQNGIDVATGDWIGFLDDDDIISDKWYQELNNAINENKDIDVFAFKVFQTGLNRVTGFRCHVGTYLIRKKYLLENKIKFHSSLRYGEDKYFISLFVYSSLFDKRIKFIPKVLYFWHTDNEDSTTHRIKIDWDKVAEETTKFQDLWFKENRPEIVQNKGMIRELYKDMIFNICFPIEYF